MFTKFLKICALFSFSIFLYACNDSQKTANNEVVSPQTAPIKIGATAGDFYDMLRLSIVPMLEEQGYNVNLIEFNDYVQPNLALAEGDLDINVFQHLPYLEGFKAEHNINIIEGFEIPTPPYGIYSGKLNSIDDVKKGSSIAVPNDPSNFARVLVILDHLGWIKLKENVNPLTASKADILENVMDIQFIEVTASLIPRVRQDADFAAINGNYAISAGIPLTDAILAEPSFNYINWSAIRPEDQNSAWYIDIKNAYSSDEFQKFISENYAGYQLPSAW